MPQHEYVSSLPDHLFAIRQTVLRDGTWTSPDGRYTINAPEDSWSIWVIDNQGGSKVAHSSMRSDFDQSLDEFIFDYVGGR